MTSQTPFDARALVAAVRRIPVDVVGHRSMTPQQVLGIGVAFRAAHLLADLAACHEVSATELVADGLRSILESMVHGRYALHCSDADVARWPVSFDRRRLAFAEELGRDPSQVDITEPESAGAVGLPGLKQQAEKVDESDPPSPGRMGSLDAYHLLYGPLSDRQVHAGPGTISRYLAGGHQVQFVEHPDPLLSSDTMLTVAVAATGALYEDVCQSFRALPGESHHVV